jgi:K+-sensing histidine kinase KdpD
MTKLKKMMKSVEHALTAASFAEEGDRETARSLMQESRRVLLALKAGQIDARTLKYALNTAKRINAQLDILHVVPPRGSGQEPALESFLPELAAEGITFRLITRSGCLKQRIIEYTNSEKEILFAVIESPSSLDADCDRQDKELSELWRKLKCPLVVVMDGARASEVRSQKSEVRSQKSEVRSQKSEVRSQKSEEEYLYYLRTRILI